MTDFRLSGYRVEAIASYLLDSQPAHYFSYFILTLVNYGERLLKIAECEADHITLDADVDASIERKVSCFDWILMVFLARNIAVDTEDGHIAEVLGGCLNATADSKVQH